MGFFQAIVYGIVQGIAEWLPISSTAHLRVVPALLGWPDPGAAFTAVIQLGTLLAVLIYFRNDLGKALMAWVRSIGDPAQRRTVEGKMGWAIFFGTLPIVICGLLFQHDIKGSLRSLNVVAVMLIVVGIVMLIAERFGKQRRGIEDVTVKDGIIVGLWQAVALIPGASRSGSTISGSLFSGFDRGTAARFSFLLSVPSIFAAGLKELWEIRHDIAGPMLGPIVVATIVSFIVGYASIAWLIGYLQRRSTGIFVAYRIALGILLLALISAGKLDPNAGIAPEVPSVSTTR
ncbi:MAG: undecaprenyl-diphosphate phosphatase [Chthonomonas sp.]|nr:undecaprenyl-diphosphate phosphatase [Chthonomonas sp.]